MGKEAYSPYRVDNHPQREELLADIMRGLSDGVIGEKYGYHRTTIQAFRNRQLTPVNKRAVETVYRETLHGLANRLIDKVTDLDAIHAGLRDRLMENGKMKEIFSPVELAGFNQTVELLLKAQSVFGQQIERLDKMGLGIAQSYERADVESETGELIDAILKALEPFKEARDAVIDAAKQCGRTVSEESLTGRVHTEPRLSALPVAVGHPGSKVPSPSVELCPAVGEVDSHCGHSVARGEDFASGAGSGIRTD